MTVEIKASIDRLSMSSNSSVGIKWTRDTGIPLYPHLNNGRTKFRDDYLILYLGDDPKDGLHVFVRAGSKVRFHKLEGKNVGRKEQKKR
jgi:hypothetical protein